MLEAGYVKVNNVHVNVGLCMYMHKLVHACTCTFQFHLSFWRETPKAREPLSCWRETSQSPGTLILLEGNLPKPRDPSYWLTNQPTSNQQATNNQLTTDYYTATIGHGGVDAPLKISWKCGNIWPPLAADQSALPLRRCWPKSLIDDCQYCRLLFFM